MIIITLPRAVVEQALEALEWHLERGAYGADIEDVTGNLRTALAQQAEPPGPRWEGDDNITSPWNACMHKNYCVALKEEREYWLAQQAEPVPMPPFPPVSQWNRGCAVCGIGADGNAYGYVCPRSDCPTKVTCGGVA